MNWKQAPHLFCNGQFQVKSGNTFDLIGISSKQYLPNERCLLVYNLSGQIIERNIEDCTLIARPIVSMLDEELRGLGISSSIGLAFGIQEPESFHDALYLLSLGIYPFDQSHFQDGTVIARER